MFDTLPVSAIVVSIFGGLLLKRFCFRKDTKLNTLNWEPNVVYLYQFYRIKCIPSFSPYALKLETWLRLKKIPYVSRECIKFSRGGRQSPFIELNGEEIFDTNVIIPRLRREFGLGEDDVDDESRGADVAISRMLDEHLAHSYFWYRYAIHWNDEFLPLWTFPIPAYVRFFISFMQPRGMKRKANVVGHGRLPTDTIYKLGMEDLKALSLYLGPKRFLHGDVMATSDCAALGHLAQILCIPINHPHRGFIFEECPNLIHYVERVKAALWPDWQEILDKIPY